MTNYFLILELFVGVFWGGIDIDKPTLWQSASFPIGASANTALLSKDTLYRKVVIEEFNSITSENALKMNRVHIRPDAYDWSGGDFLADFARQNNKRFHAHTLVWHLSLPNWVQTFSGDSLGWEKLLKNHIQTVVNHYKGKVKSWDVVNEAFNDDGSLRKTIWYEHLGPDYIARCFQYAHQADPDALLFYNDYGQEVMPLKSKAIKAMALDFKKRMIPIDGIGLQSHITIFTSDSLYRLSLNEAVSTGLLIHISELDIRLNPQKKRPFLLTEALYRLQENKYKNIVSAYKAITPKKQQYGITIWNVGDKDSYAVEACKCLDAPMPFDTNYNKKMAYNGFLAGLK